MDPLLPVFLQPTSIFQPIMLLILYLHYSQGKIPIGRFQETLLAFHRLFLAALSAIATISFPLSLSPCQLIGPSSAVLSLLVRRGRGYRIHPCPLLFPGPGFACFGGRGSRAWADVAEWSIPEKTSWSFLLFFAPLKYCYMPRYLGRYLEISRRSFVRQHIIILGGRGGAANTYVVYLGGGGVAAPVLPGVF